MLSQWYPPEPDPKVHLLAKALAEQLVVALNAPEEENQAKQTAMAKCARQFDWQTTAHQTVEQLVLALGI